MSQKKQFWQMSMRAIIEVKSATTKCTKSDSGQHKPCELYIVAILMDVS